ncbi:hypothetical protein STEG23_023191 [Scotinomys teguina]
MVVVAAAPSCQLLLIMLMAVILLPKMKDSPLLVQTTVTRTIVLQETISKGKPYWGTQYITTMDGMRDHCVKGCKSDSGKYQAFSHVEFKFNYMERGHKNKKGDYTNKGRGLKREGQERAFLHHLPTTSSQAEVHLGFIFLTPPMRDSSTQEHTSTVYKFLTRERTLVKCYGASIGRGGIQWFSVKGCTEDRSECFKRIIKNYEVRSSHCCRRPLCNF